jgi:hypothetical protein
MVACCSCLVSRNGVATLSARNDLLYFPLVQIPITAITVKLVATLMVRRDNHCVLQRLPATLNGRPVCRADILPSEATRGFASGMRAWATHIHSPGAVTNVSLFGAETEFSQVPLSENERDYLSNHCAFINAGPTGVGICRSCSQGAQ